jgi:hypothetical protein
MADKHKYIAIADDGRGTRSWSIMAEGALPARQQAIDSLKDGERLCLIALVTWECEWPEHGHSKSGVPLTEAKVQELSDRAERGFWPMSSQWGE